jgi:hypothetical protein
LSFWNFCRVLQISPKHFKFYQYKSFPVFRGTQLSCWMAFQILSGKGGKLGQLQFSLFISTLQNPNFAWRSCSNRQEKHRTTFANVVEGCLIYNFRIYHFYRTVQFFGETRGQSKVDQLKCSSAGALEGRRHAGRPAGLALLRAPRTECYTTSASVQVRSYASRRGPSVPFAPATSKREPPPRRACRAVPPPRVAQGSFACAPAHAS